MSAGEPSAGFAAGLRDRVGEEIFVSDWFEILQADIDAFAQVTRDWDYMHNDPEWAAEKGPWPTTIAHGFYLLSLIAHFHGEAGFPTLATDDEYVINYGLDRVRFVEPVQIGDRIRVRMELAGITEKKPGRDLIRTRATYETKRCGGRPHVVVEALSLCVHGAAYTDPR
jgi:acyl dehydratase